MQTFGIILVSYCGKADTLECIKSLLNCSRNDIQVNVIIIDNASPRFKIEISDLYGLFKDYKGVHVCELLKDMLILKSYEEFNIMLYNSKENNGFGAGNNIGISILKKLNVDCAILLNNDTIVPSSFFTNIKRKFNGIKYSLAVSPLSKNYYNHAKIDSEGFGYFDMFTGRCSHIKKYNISYLVGSCIIVNNVYSMPYFDEEFFLYCEDVDYTFKLKEAGYKTEFDELNYFYHKVSSSTSKNPKMDSIKLSSMKYLISKHASRCETAVFYISRSLYYILKFKFANLKDLWNFNQN